MKKKLQRRQALGRGSAVANINNYSGSGYLLEDDLLADLRGSKGALTYRQMADGSPIVGCVLYCMQMVLDSVQWRLVTGAETETSPTPATEQDIEFLSSVLFEDMRHPFANVVTDCLSMLVYGFSISEIVYKLRTEDNSLYPDGRIGIDRTIHIPQESIHKWTFGTDGELTGVEQYTNTQTGVVFIPIDKCIHSRAHTSRGTPEGRSVLRNAYRPWYFARNIERIEAVGIERELAGLPVMYVPNQILEDSAAGDAKARGILDSYLKVSKNVRLNEQAGLVLPSDTYTDADDKPTTIPLVELKLLSSSGTRAIDTNRIVTRHETNIARSMMADFIMLGTSGGGGGAYSLGKDKSSLFESCLTGWLTNIETILQRQIVRPLWYLNGKDINTMPYISHTPMLRESFDQFCTAMEKLTRSGMALFPSESLEEYIRDRFDLPRQTPEEKSRVERVATMEEELLENPPEPKSDDS